MEISDNVQENLRGRYCSWCYSKCLHEIVEKNMLQRNIYECTSCKGRTLVCRAPGCTNMTQGLSKDSAWNDEFCAEHDGTISNFENLNKKLDDLVGYEDIYKRSKFNLAKASKISAISIGGALVLGPAMYLAGPAIGGAIGSQFYGLSGAAATSKGLAVLGGGSLASGGAGMSGGLAVLTVTGAALGGANGAHIAGSYYNDAKFKIEKVKSGKDPKVIIINGFRTQNTSKTDDWIDGLSKRFSENSWYRLDWEAQDQKNLFNELDPKSYGIYKKLVKQAIKATKKNKGPAAIFALNTFKNLIKNPWFIAQYKASQTSVILADLIARLKNSDDCILMGHSLGGRIALDTAKILSTKSNSQISEVHLLGCAANPLENEDEELLSKGVNKYLFNYFSENDAVLSKLYKYTNYNFENPIGYNGLGANNSKLIDVNVTKYVANHSSYRKNFKKYIRFYAK